MTERRRSTCWVLLLLLGLTGSYGQGLPLPGKQGLTARDYARVRTWAAEGRTWRASYAADPAAACNAQTGLCVASPGSEDYGKLLVATSPADYDARTSSSDVISPVLDQRPCQAAVAFAVITAAQAAVASALRVNASTVSLSQQDLQFCPDATRSCQDTWDVQAAVDRLINGSIVSDECLPYTAAATDDPAKLCNYRCKDQPSLLQGGRFRAVPVRSPMEAQRQIRRYSSFVTRFNIYQDFLDWVRNVAPTDPAAVYECPNSGQSPSEGHAVAVVGYNNTEGLWIVKNSWGTGNGDKGFFKVRYGVCGMLAPGDTLGVSFIPAQPVTLNVSGPVPDPLSPSRNRTCYNYTAQPGDFLSKVADAAVIKVGQLLLDNNSTLKDLDQALSGSTLLLCDPDPSSVSTNTARKATPTTPAISSAAANASATAAGLSPSPLPSSLGGYVPSTMPSPTPAAVAEPELPPPSLARPGRTRPAVATPAEEAAALLALKETLGFKNPQWQGTEPCADQPWPNVYCNTQGRVFMVDLSSQGLTGALSKAVDLASIPFLQALWLFDNPTLTGSLPASWSQLGRLRELSLYGCSLTGSLPSSWGSMKRLQQLFLHNNKLTGSLPEEWGSLGALTSLGLATNELSGNIPTSWTGMRSLKSISVFDNAGLAGCLPSTWLSRSSDARVQLTKPADNVRPLAGTRLCRTCTAQGKCKAVGSTGAATAGGAGVEGSSKGGRVVPPLVPPTRDPGAIETPAVAPSKPPGYSPTLPQGSLVLPGPSSSASPGAITGPGATATGPGATATGPGATAAGPGAIAAPGATATGPADAAGVNATSGGAAVIPTGPVPPVIGPVAPSKPADPAAAAAAAAAAATGGAAGDSTPKADAAGAPAVVSPAPASAASPSPAPIAPTAPTLKPAASSIATPAGGAAASAAASPPPLPAITPASPPPPAAAPTTAPATPPPPPAAPAPAAASGSPSPPPPAPQAPPVPVPNPIGSLPVPVDPSLTVVPDNRKPNFQDVQLSGRRLLLRQLQGAL